MVSGHQHKPFVTSAIGKGLPRYINYPIAELVTNEDRGMQEQKSSAAVRRRTGRRLLYMICCRRRFDLNLFTDVTDVIDTSDEIWGWSSGVSFDHVLKKNSNLKSITFCYLPFSGNLGLELRDQFGSLLNRSSNSVSMSFCYLPFSAACIDKTPVESPLMTSPGAFF